jgi:hypothetical protein
MVTALLPAGRLAMLFAAIVGLMILEGIVLGLRWHFSRRGVPLLELVVNLLAGASLLMAASVAVLRVPGPWLAICLVQALLMHVVDLRLRWQGRAVRRTNPKR